jgi:hypothetical protein
MTDDSYLNNEFYTRPDFKPKMAMIDVEDQTDYDPKAMEQLLDHAYGKYKSEPKKSALYRLLWPNAADFKPKTNVWLGTNPDSAYKASSGAFPTLHHDYADHQH